ncbi:MAG: AI-2E family transporter [Silvibacterium sp.]
MKPASTPSSPLMNAPSIARNRPASLAGEPVILLGLVLLGLYFARPVLIPLAMALSLSFLLTPAVTQVERLRVRRAPAVLMVMVMALLLAGVVGWIVARQVIGVVNDLPKYRDNIQGKLDSLHVPTTGPLSHTVNSIREIGAEISNETQPKTPKPEELHTFRERERERLQADKVPVPVSVVPPPQTASQYLSQYALPIMKPLGVLLMVVIFTIYMLLKREDLRNRLLLLAGMGRLNLMSQAMNEAAARISRYLIMNVMVNAGYGVIFGTGLYLLGVPNATLWGALMGILRMIPYAGTMIAGVSTLAFTLAVFNNWWHPLWVLLLFGVLEFVIANFVEPHIYGKRTGISAFALVVMAIVWTLLWGWPGLIVSTPLTVCLIVMGRHIPQMSFLHILLGEDAELSPDAHFYERLLAMDQSEAHGVADSFLEHHTLIELYDEVVLPALILSEQDRHKGVLDEVHSAWLYQSATELVAELTDYKPPQAAESANEPVADSDTAPAAGPVTDMVTETDTEPVCDPETMPEWASPIVCVPAEDQADEIVGTMLAQLLEQCGHRTMLLSVSALSPEIMERLAADPDTILCISAVPPFAFAQARKLAQHLRENLPKNPIVVGLWGGTGDVETVRGRFGNARANAIATTLSEALTRVKKIDKETEVHALQ